MSTVNELVDAAPPAKYSRYRAVRRATNTEPNPSPVVEEVKPKEDGVARSMSMSRYRRPRAATRTDASVTSPPVPQVPQLPRQVYPQSVNSDARSVAARGKEPIRIVTDPTSRQHGGAQGYGQPRETEEERARRKAKQAQFLEDEKRRDAVQQAALEAQSQKDAEEEASRILAEQKKKDLQRLEAELEAASPVQRITSPREKLMFFARKKSTKPTSPVSPVSSTESSGLNAVLGPRPKTSGSPKSIGAPRPFDQSLVAEQKPEAPRKLEPPRIEITQAIGQGGGGIVPQTDAPLSASNAGERRVLIRCKQSSINLPITPETTPVQLIYSAANVMTQNISPSSAILIESYTQLGLERRVRRYEHVRDILNSWDRDTQNALVIENSDSPNFDHDLEVAHGAKFAPKDVTVQMYYSQKPGKWSRRYVTLLAMGQIFVSKKPDSNVTDKDVVNICHLSDFDIYTPNAQQMRKVLRPPKKYCYAIKSQQKNIMFLNTENFVHFFSTDDLQLAESWHGTVQRWRSWYLVTRLGEGKKSVGGRSVKKSPSTVLSRGGSGAGQSSKISADQNPYTIGSFQPLFDMERFGSPSSNDQDRDSQDESMPRQIPFHLRHGAVAPPPRRENNRHPPVVTYKISAPEEDEAFASGGLLGRTYSQRQRELKKDNDGNPADGPASYLLHRSSLSLKSTKRPEILGNSNLQHSTSQRQKPMPKPLLDFTPTFKEAPQWDKSNKGHGVKATEGIPLVDVATGLEDRANPGLPVTLFRRETVGSNNTSARPKTASSTKAREGAFVKGGLVVGL